MKHFNLEMIIFLTAIFCYTETKLCAQLTVKNKTKDPAAYITYYSFGLGANQLYLQPNFVMHGTRYNYTYESNTVRRKKDLQIQKISSGSFRQSSIDSILSLTEILGDTLIYNINPCIMSGHVEYIIVSDGVDTTKFTMWNTTNRIVLQIIDIINKYLPVNDRLPRSEKRIQMEADCLKSEGERIKKLIDSMKSFSKSPNGP